MSVVELRSQTEHYFAQKQYAAVIEVCEQAIEHHPNEPSHYWYLGLALLLQGNETAAQAIWLAPILEAEPEQAEQWAIDLVDVLRTEAERQEANADYKTAWLLRQHLREFAPEDLENLLIVLDLGLKATTLSSEDELLLQITNHLQQVEPSHLPIELEQLFKRVQQIVAISGVHANTIALLEACIPHIITTSQMQVFANLFLAQAMQDFQAGSYLTAIQLARFCVQLTPDDPNLLFHAVFLLQTGRAVDLLESIPLAKQLLEKSVSLSKKISATHHILTGLMLTCGSWQETYQYYQLHKNLLQSLATPDLSISLAQVSFESEDKLHELLAMGIFSHYFEDVPAMNRSIRNKVAEIAQDKWRSYLPDRVERYRNRNLISRQSNQPLKIGYLSSCLRIHSVGWLVRWLLSYHDRNRFDIHLYSTRRSDDPLQQAFSVTYGENFHHLPNSATEIADQIERDQIDILVELDSITAFDTCVVTSLKPAPIQVSWLGFDASGIPAIDYYMADPYVLPKQAQNYYSEKIWRLPQTYIAVEGFEVGVPDLRRDQLGIPNDAIVYLSSQTALKRNPENIRLQLKILKEVSNSYFLIKSFNSEPELLKNFFYQLAEEAGVNLDRLRFLPDFPDNSIYRANLRLADVILDTYPYNGATTTLEALWIGLPIVTRVGEQFAARNSYTMMMNVGVTEGLAWTDEEYVEWGIRLGEDETLRRTINYRLMQSRRTSPLWNSWQFTRDMEKAYEQMWKTYCNR